MEDVPHRQLIWMLICLSTPVLPAITFATAILLHYMALWRPVHCTLGKWVRYLRGTSEFSFKLCPWSKSYCLLRRGLGWKKSTSNQSPVKLSHFAALQRSGGATLNAALRFQRHRMIIWAFQQLLKIFLAFQPLSRALHYAEENDAIFWKIKPARLRGLQTSLFFVATIYISLCTHINFANKPNGAMQRSFTSQRWHNSQMR